MRFYVHPSVQALVLGSSMALVGLAGCESNAGAGGVLRSGIPPEATIVREGESPMTYQAKQAGQLYLYDATDDKVVRSFHLRNGQTFVMDSASGRATIDGNEADIAKLSASHNYQLYFWPEALGAR